VLQAGESEHHRVGGNVKQLRGGVAAVMVPVYLQVLLHQRRKTDDLLEGLQHSEPAESGYGLVVKGDGEIRSPGQFFQPRPFPGLAARHSLLQLAGPGKGLLIDNIM